MPSRSNTRIGELIELKARTPIQKKALENICVVMDEILDGKYDSIEDLAKNRFAEELLQESTDFRSLYFLINGMCHKSEKE